MFLAGKARHRVTLQKPQPATNDGWGEGEEYIDVVTVQASVEPIRGRERMAADTVMADVDHRVRIRNTPNVAELDETWRLKWEHGGSTRTLDIVAAIDEHGRGRKWELLTKEHRER